MEFSVDDVNKALGKSIFDIMEAETFSQILISRNVWGIGGAELSHDWRAYSIAAIISYSRPYKISYGLPQIHKYLGIEHDDFNRTLHEELLKRRDKIVAHGDSDSFSIFDKYPNGNAMRLSSCSMYLSKVEAESLVSLGTQIISYINNIRSNQDTLANLYTKMTAEQKNPKNSRVNNG